MCGGGARAFISAYSLCVDIGCLDPIFLILHPTLQQWQMVSQVVIHVFIVIIESGQVSPLTLFPKILRTLLLINILLENTHSETSLSLLFTDTVVLCTKISISIDYFNKVSFRGGNLTTHQVMSLSEILFTADVVFLHILIYPNLQLYPMHSCKLTKSITGAVFCNWSSGKVDPSHRHQRHVGSQIPWSRRCHPGC